MSTDKAETYMVINETTRQHVISKLDNTGNYEVTIRKISESKVRSGKQNKSIHVYCEMLASEYNSKDLDKAIVLNKQLSRPWGMIDVKEDQWRVIQVAMGFSESTTKLEPAQVSRVYKALNKHTYNTFDINIDFPCEESMRMKAIYGV